MPLFAITAYKGILWPDFFYSLTYLLHSLVLITSGIDSFANLQEELLLAFGYELCCKQHLCWEGEKIAQDATG